MKALTSTIRTPLGKRRIPRAYALSKRGQAALVAKLHRLEYELSLSHASHRLVGFLQIINSGFASINMSLANCVRFVETGQWLNIYEAEAVRTGKSGAALFRHVQRKIPKWFNRRRTIERLLRFRLDTHYASLNVGGAGPTRYGVCCVELDPKLCEPYCTCFSGDTLRAVFDEYGTRILGDDEILEKFAAHGDIAALAAIGWSHLLSSESPAISEGLVKNALEASDSVIEIHVHGPVYRTHVRRVVMERKDLDSLWDLTCRSERFHGRNPPQEFDAVPHFKRLLNLLEIHGIPLVTE